MMWETERDSTGGRDENTGVIISGKQAMTTDGFEHRDGSWYVATDVPSDLLIQVGDVRFHVHKYPLLSRSAKMNDILYKSKDTEINKVEFQDLPGGPEAFELVAKFCYGIPIDLTASNISGLRCASEYLEMTEDLDEGNLIFKTEAFLSYVVLASWRDSIVVLKSCEHLSPWAENLQIVRRCCESIAWKACANPQGIRWAYTAKITGTSSTKWIDTKDCSQQVPSDWWFEDVSILRIDHFVRVMTAIKVKATKLDLLGTAIMYYGAKWVPGLSNEVSGEDGGKSKEIDSNWKGGLHLIVPGFKEDQHSIELREQKMIIESLISIIPPHKDTVSCGFLLRLLRMANAMKVAPALITELEKRVGMQLEQASLADLLIPSCHNSETIYDVDAVQRILEHFLVQEQMESSSPGRRTVTPRIGGSNARARVARLIDSCLTEVSKDRNLSPTKFQVLAEALPESARSCDDGLYRAIDSYLKAHPMMSEHERKRLCRVMDCQKLSIDACMHAAQNERLPLRVVVQVLFSGQVKISNAIANNSFKEGGETYYSPVMPSRKALLEGTQPSFQDSWATAKDINMLKFELESVKAKYLELQNDIEVLQRQFEKTLKPKQHLSAWSNGWKKLNQLTRMARNETQEVTTSVEQTRKLPRRWRNSIS